MSSQYGQRSLKNVYIQRTLLSASRGKWTKPVVYFEYLTMSSVNVLSSKNICFLSVTLFSTLGFLSQKVHIKDFVSENAIQFTIVVHILHF